MAQTQLEQVVSDDTFYVDVAKKPEAEINYDNLPDKTIQEMVAGRRAVERAAGRSEEVNILMTQTAEEMFAKQAQQRLRAKCMEFQSGTKLAVRAALDVGAHEWFVTVQVHRPGLPMSELREPFPQFPSDEMIAWISMVA